MKQLSTVAKRFMICHSFTKFQCFSMHIQPPFYTQKLSSLADECFIVDSICKTLHKNQKNWDNLTNNFSSVKFTNSIIKNTLLHLKQPINAKKALTFFHWSAQLNHFPHEVSTYCITIHILVKARYLKDAKVLLGSLLMRVSENEGKDSFFIVLDSIIDSYGDVESTPLVFDLFMQTCAKLRMIDCVLEACKILDENGFMLSVVTYNVMLYVIQKSDRCSLLWGVYEHMIENRKRPNESTVKILVDGLCKEGRLQKFLDMLDRILGKRCSSPLVIVNTCLVYGMIDDGRIEEGLVLLKRMLQNHMILDVIGCSLVVLAKLKKGDLEAAWEVFEGMLKRGFDGNSFVYTLFIGAYCDQRMIEDAVEVLEEMENSGFKPFDETFDCLIQGCCRTQWLEDSLKYCERMMEMGLVPSRLAFNEMTNKLCENGYSKRVDEMLTVLLDKGFVPDSITYSCLIAGYGKEGNVEDALKLYYEMEYKSISPDAAAFNSLIVSLCHHKRLSEVEKFLMVMKDRQLRLDSFIYDIIISSYLDKRDKIRAQELCREMVGVQVRASN
ncbi:hypothetical protein LIER_19203 [Lithospermum erythrorhizon]|uniref:Pentatricopeptide repeat-containing protein n=1 Tax=Lithospermum erythrorhizon TaxID=34254 RepID=A0AAV3QGX5_LITER